jgi:hypothetical protein
LNRGLAIEPRLVHSAPGKNFAAVTKSYNGFYAIQAGFLSEKMRAN